jgi:mRNA-degrading endonuclease RelE of RelBE toxin-antitoxin system
MAREARFILVYAPETIDHMAAIERKYHRLIRDTLKGQLTFTPGAETRNRKPLEPPALLGATWELRLGPNNRFRVFYSINETEHIVEILAIGIKEGSRMTVAGEEWNL